MIFEVDKSNLKKYHMVNSSLNALEICDGIINNFINEEISFVNIYGLLQGLFVGIDALYSLSYAINDNKYMVNINTNDTLRKIKYVRNDCVGHPTNREYSSSLGYCYLDENISKEKISYIVYKVKNNKEIKNSYDVNLIKTIESFNIEKDNIIKALTNSYKKSFKMSNYMLALFDDVNQISKIKDLYISNYNNSSYDRFIWRLSIIEDLKDLNDEISNYLRFDQIYRVYKMCCNVEKIKPITKSFKMPKVIIDYIKYLKNNDITLDYTNDSFSGDFKNLLNVLKNSNQTQIYNYLEKHKNNKNIIYALDKIVRGNL